MVTMESRPCIRELERSGRYWQGFAKFNCDVLEYNGICLYESCSVYRCKSYYDQGRRREFPDVDDGEGLPSPRRASSRVVGGICSG